ncbi:MAG: twin-arginine translocase TatA/TatE family subunit [Planctomycetes bacterium]|nr:twin-arginine translocase TatA/TatE family subunit [Planctomycetota bacterium]
MIPAPALLAFNLGPSEMLVILVVGLIVFGRRLPEVGKQFGKTFLEFRKGLSSFRQQIELDEDVRETRSTMRELQREITRPVEIEPWTRAKPYEPPQSTAEESLVTHDEPRNDDLDHGPLADQGGAHASPPADQSAPTSLHVERAEDEPSAKVEPASDSAPAPTAPAEDDGAPLDTPRARES